MFNLKSLFIRNFLSFHEANISLQASGLYLIAGYNEKGQDSNGSGKSAILNAICYALFGKTATGLTSIHDLKRWDTSEAMEVSLELTDEAGQLYKVTRTEEGTSFLIAGEKVEGHKRDVQASINECFKTSYELFLSAVMLAAGQTEFIAAASDATKKKLFKPIFQLDIIDKYYAVTQEELKALTTQADKLSYDIMAKKSMLEEHQHHVEIYATKSSQWSVNRQTQIIELEERKGTIKVIVDPLLKQRVKELELKLATIPEKVDVSEEIQKLESDKMYLKVLYGENAEILDESNRLVGTECKYCGAEINLKNLNKHRGELIKRTDEIIYNATVIDSKLTTLREKQNKYDALLEERSEIQEELDSVQRILFQEEAVASSQQLIKDSIDKSIRELKESSNPYEQDVAYHEKKANATAKELEELEAQLSKITKEIDLCGFLKWTFSREGVTAFIIERAFGRLESLANRYLSMISTEGFQIEIKPQRELKTKAMKEEIEIRVKLGKRIIPYWGLSDGQRHRVNVALLIAVNRLCRDRGINSFNFLLLDEVLDLSLADKGQEDVIRLMRWMLQELHNIIVISHRNEISKDFDFLIEVQRGKDEISRIVSSIVLTTEEPATTHRKRSKRNAL